MAGKTQKKKEKKKGGTQKRVKPVPCARFRLLDKDLAQPSAQPSKPSKLARREREERGERREERGERRREETRGGDEETRGGDEETRGGETVRRESEKETFVREPVRLLLQKSKLVCFFVLKKISLSFVPTFESR